MKRFLAIMFLTLSCLTIQGQVKITTKKVKISDFPQKITKVVLTGNQILDSSLREEVARRWNASAFEFCTFDEFEGIKENEDFYFLQVLKSGTGKNGGVVMLSLFKGGKEPLTVVDMPFYPENSTSGREFIFLPAMLDIIQDFTREAMGSDDVGYNGLLRYSNKFARKENLKIYISKDDLSGEVESDLISKLEADGMVFPADTDGDDVMSEDVPGALVSLVVAPEGAKTGDVCYKLLFSTGRHDLYYFRKSRITKKSGVGFNSTDLKTISLTKQ